MGAFVSTKPVRVHAEDDSGEWIDVKPKLSTADRRDILDQSCKGMGADATITLGSASYAMMEIGFVNWLLFAEKLDDEGEPVFDKDGKPVMVEVPFSKDAMGDLDDDHPLLEAAIERLGSLNPTLLGTKENDGSES